MEPQVSHPKLPMILAIGITAIIFGLGGYLIASMANSNTTTDTSVTTSSTATVTSSASPTTASTSSTSTTTNWQTYTNNTYAFSIKYPTTLDLDIEGADDEKWIAKAFDPSADNAADGLKQSISFGPPSSAPGGYIWGINIYDKNKKSIEDLIKTHGSQFKDRKEERKAITINGISATLVTVTTQQIDGWVAKAVLFEKNGNIYDISNGAVDKNSEWEAFYSSLKFTK